MDYNDKLTALAREDGRYAPEALFLVLEALGTAVNLLKERQLEPNSRYADNRTTEEGKQQFHISGQELLEGFRLHMLKNYGNMSKIMLERWGIQRTEDVGEIVYLMIEADCMSRHSGDSLEDFNNGYSFAEAFNVDTTLGD